MSLDPVDAPALRRSLLDAAPLLLGVGLLMAGNGLTGTLLGVRAGLEGFGHAVTGVVLAGYYAGFLVGSIVAPSTIRRVGHVRAFAGLASLASAVVLVHVVEPQPLSWLLLRGVSGLCVSGLYVVCETWLNGAVTNATRGMLLASYMVVVTGGIGVGQVLFSVADPRGFAVFVLASVLVSLAVVPVSLVAVRAPDTEAPEHLSVAEVAATAPLGVVTAAVSGFAGAALLGAGTVYAVAAGLGRGGTSALLGAALAGALALQVPLGRWSDRIDRRYVIAAAAALGVAASAAAAIAGPGHRAAVLVCTLVAGGVAFPLYSLAIAHLNDYLGHDKVVAAGARMVLINGAGAVGGPVAGAAAVQAVGPRGLFLAIAAPYALVVGYALWRITRRAAAPEEERASYVALPAVAAPTIALLQDGAADELHPPTERRFMDDGALLRVRERGTGDPVLVLVQDLAAGDGEGEGLLRGLAADGVRAIATDAASVGTVLAVLRRLELPEVTVVGLGDRHALVSALLADHPDRVRAVVTSQPVPGAADRLVLELDPPASDGDADCVADAVVDFLRHEVLDPALRANA